MTRNTVTNNRRALAACIIAMAITAITVSLPAYALQPVTLTLVGSAGTVTKNEVDILAMPSTSGIGGTRSSSGSISNAGTYQGVSMLYLCNLVGGLQNGSKIRAIDVTGNYITEFNYSQVHDGSGFATYNATTGTQQPATQPLTLILAYSYNGSELSSSNGPLRATIVGPEGLATSSSLWNKQVAKVEVIPPYLQPVTLTLTGSTGNLTKNETEILAMPSTAGLGGTRGSSGAISNYGSYQGISVLYLCNLVGGIQNGSIIKTTDVTGNYVTNFTYSQTSTGEGFITYNQTTGNPQNATQPLTLILAYSYNGTELISSSGPLRAVIVGPEGLATTSSLWNKQVTKIEVINAPPIPEHTPAALIAGFVGLAVVTLFGKRLIKRPGFGYAKPN